MKIGDILKIVGFVISLVVASSLLYAKLSILEFRMGLVERGLADLKTAIEAKYVPDKGAICQAYETP